MLLDMHMNEMMKNRILQVDKMKDVDKQPLYNNLRWIRPTSMVPNQGSEKIKVQIKSFVNLFTVYNKMIQGYQCYNITTI